MKLIPSIVALIMHVIICNSQEIPNKKQMPDMEKMPAMEEIPEMPGIYMPIITPETEYFDPNHFRKEYKGVVLDEPDKDTGIKYIERLPRIYYEKDEKKNIIVNYHKSRETGIMEGSIYPNNSIIGIKKVFYKSGHLKAKGLRYYYNFQIGIWYEFDEQGNLINTIDKDEHFPFGWKDILAYCKENDISIERSGGLGGKRTLIQQMPKKEEWGWEDYFWAISYANEAVPKGELIYINSKTGEIFRRIARECCEIE